MPQPSHTSGLGHTGPMHSQRSPQPSSTNPSPEQALTHHHCQAAVDATTAPHSATTLHVSIHTCSLPKLRGAMPPRSVAGHAVDVTPLVLLSPLASGCSKTTPLGGRTIPQASSSSDPIDPDLGFPMEHPPPSHAHRRRHLHEDDDAVSVAAAQSGGIWVFTPVHEQMREAEAEWRTLTTPICRGRRPPASPSSWPEDPALDFSGLHTSPSLSSDAAPATKGSRRPDQEAWIGTASDPGRVPPRPPRPQAPPATISPPVRPRGVASTCNSRRPRATS